MSASLRGYADRSVGPHPKRSAVRLHTSFDQRKQAHPNASSAFKEVGRKTPNIPCSVRPFEWFAVRFYQPVDPRAEPDGRQANLLDAVDEAVAAVEPVIAQRDVIGLA
jgi:hypothetical protein